MPRAAVDAATRWARRYLTEAERIHGVSGRCSVRAKGWCQIQGFAFEPRGGPTGGPTQRPWAAWVRRDGKRWRVVAADAQLQDIGQRGVPSDIACSIEPGCGLPPRAPGPGFAVALGKDGLRVECFVSAGRLRCLTYGGERRPPAGACNFGGTIPSAALTRDGRLEVGFTCVDEGFHEWFELARGLTFRSGSFRCAHQHTRRRSALRCVSRGRGFVIGTRGRVGRA
ncbi:hypothetical protein [Conexibacter arvalis]|uniref:Uncharacterized protein n=1 Tax=Conexibacter arvalis TaxID=912552 RepID=A0A840IEN7_9ACTN|nr:hypothetical protein [Conexibacter arvalis]MBB4663467.1 hypothetical protein [Conexibacter arvalis]